MRKPAFPKERISLKYKPDTIICPAADFIENMRVPFGKL